MLNFLPGLILFLGGTCVIHPSYFLYFWGFRRLPTRHQRHPRRCARAGLTCRLGRRKRLKRCQSRPLSWARTTPEEDGSFQLSDLEPDVYELRVIYSGGLTPDASESAYQQFSRRLLLQEGGNVDLGDVELQLGVGSVSGQLSVEEGLDISTATVNLSRTPHRTNRCAAWATPPTAKPSKKMAASP